MKELVVTLCLVDTGNSNIFGESTSLEMKTNIEDVDYYYDHIERYVSKNLQMFKMDRDNVTPIAKALRLIEDIYKIPVFEPAVDEHDDSVIVPYPENTDITIEVAIE